jgi:preprotein translocase subunit YajC
MYLMNLSALLADAAPAAPQQQPNATDLLRGPLVPMVVILGAFFYITSRSQKKKVKEHEEKIKSLKSGDKIITNSGIIATVVTVKEDSISIRSADAKFEITKASVADIRERSGEATAS